MRRRSLVDGRAVERLLLIAGAVRSGIIDALGDGSFLTADEVATRASTDLRATRVILEALAAEGLAEVAAALHEEIAEEGRSEPRYCLTPEVRAHLVEKGPDFERNGLLHQVNKTRGWLELPEVIRTGKPVRRPEGSRDYKTMAAAMGERDPALLDLIVEQCLAYGGPVRDVLDVGGAVGHIARRFARKGCRVTLLDQPEVIAIAREYLRESREYLPEGDHGVELVACDFTKALPGGPFDLVYFGNVYHIYGPDTNARVTKEAFSVLVPGGVIAIQDYVWGRSREAAMFAVNMLRSTEEGGVWSEEQYCAWLEEAGFAQIRVDDLDDYGCQLILAKRPLHGR
ncbi:MAG: methyltransferase [Thermoleophilia bacterium]|nr:methyltransferase [Thermoleophilia bacterium]